MPDQLVQKLKLHQWTCMATKKRLGKMYKGEDYIIVHPSDGKPIYPEYLSQMLTKLQKKAIYLSAVSMISDIFALHS